MFCLLTTSIVTPLLCHRSHGSLREHRHDRGPASACGREILWAREDDHCHRLSSEGVRSGSVTVTRGVGRGTVYEAEGEQTTISPFQHMKNDIFVR